MDKKIYIASGLGNADRVRALRDQFARHGVSLTFDWTEGGFRSTPEEAAKVAQQEVAGVTSAACLLLVLPGGRGSHFEAGIALHAGIPIVLLHDHPSGERLLAFHHLPELIKCSEECDAISAVLDILGATGTPVEHTGKTTR